MDACRFCREYHPGWQVCDAYIEWLERTRDDKSGGQ